MSETRAAAERLNEVLRRLGSQLKLPHPSACAIAAAKMGQQETPVPLPDPRTLEEIKQHFIVCWNESGPAGLNSSNVRELPLVLWHRSSRDEVRKSSTTLSAELPDLWPTFLLRASNREGLLLLAIDGWLRDFDLETPGLIQAGLDIANRLGNCRSPRLLAWAAAQKRFDLFIAKAGPSRLAAALFDFNESVDTTLRAACLESPIRQQGNFFRSCLVELLRQTPLEFRKHTAVEAFVRVRGLIEVEYSERGRSGTAVTRHHMRFSGMEGELARGCLLAWAEGRVHPSGPKPAVQTLLLNVIGDPRLRPQRWLDVSDDITSVMRRWISEQNLEAFLSLIKSAGDTEQWRYREAFWRACFKKVDNAEVWVILGRDLSREANLVQTLQHGFGKMNVPSQAVLLMRMRNVIFSEWSNVGRLRAWEVSDPRCPKMYSLSDYSKEELKGPCLEFPDEYGVPPRNSENNGSGLTHFSPQRGLWQTRAAFLLRQKTGIVLSRADYMPK
jgi:hypothetical protein